MPPELTGVARVSAAFQKEMLSKSRPSTPVLSVSNKKVQTPIASDNALTGKARVGAYFQKFLLSSSAKTQ